MSIEELYNSRTDNPIWNTSYPLSPEQWASYRVLPPLPFNQERELSFYIHVPFCRQLCSYCEYTRMVCPDDKLQYRYLRTLDEDVSTFVSAHPDIKLRGFDIGGGTPTSLSEDNFYYLLQIYREALDWLEVADDFEPSIEGTFDTLSTKKLNAIAQAGIRRLSLGIQSTDEQVLCYHHRRANNLAEMQEWIEATISAGINKVNLDLMYGLKGQTLETISADLKTISTLHPQQVTLYELRTNMINEKDVPSKSVLFEQYSQYYNGLIKLGYKARFGENTFSINDTDRGLSSYLRSRMLEGVSYKGFGISAQSMSHSGVSYNVGKGNRNIRNLIDLPTYEDGDTYLLPKEELASKYIAISAYNGSISLKHLSDVLGSDAKKVYKDVIDYCVNNDLLTESNNSLVITQKGFIQYGTVFSLFFLR